MYKIKSFAMQNLLVFSLENKEEDIPKQLDIQKTLENVGAQISGPMFIQVSTDLKQSKFNYYIPVNKSIIVEKNKEVSFLPSIKKKCMYVRTISTDAEEISKSMDNLANYAEEQGYEVLEPPYQVFIPVYGEVISDIYLPIKKVDLF